MTSIDNYADLEHYILSIDPKRYEQQRNYLGGSTRLSEYITRGVISLPRVRELILENNNDAASFKLLNELTWREYWQQTWRVRGDEIFSPFREITQKRAGLPKNVVEASTGIEVLDAGIRQLYETGYIHNHLRMWIAGLVCNIAQCDWRAGADWMMTHLIDGDYASNHLSWQWCAGAYTGKPYLPQQANINEFSNMVQRGTFLDTSYETLSARTIPDALTELVSLQDIPIIPGALPEGITEISLDDIKDTRQVLLYSPWTLDPNWQTDSTATRVLVLEDLFFDGTFSANVLRSVLKFNDWIPNCKILRTTAADLDRLTGSLIRKNYPAIRNWPGAVDTVELLYPSVPEKFYQSFSAFFKQAQKSIK